MVIEQRESIQIRIQVYPERQEQSRLAEWLDTHGIKAVLFDLDDTLLDTYRMIMDHKNAFIEYLHAAMPLIPLEELKTNVDVADVEVFNTHSISIPRWQAMAELVAKKYPQEPASLFTDGVSMLTGMYGEVPVLLPGALDTVKQFADTQKPLGLVTHANEHWTKLKLQTTGLGDYFDHVEVVDEHIHKSSNHWAKAIEALGVRPEEALVIGDSIPGDIQAAMDAGVKRAVLLPSPVSFYSAGKAPEGAIRAGGIGKLVETLLAIG